MCWFTEVFEKTAPTAKGEDIWMKEVMEGKHSEGKKLKAGSEVPMSIMQAWRKEGHIGALQGAGLIKCEGGHGDHHDMPEMHGPPEWMREVSDAYDAMDKKCGTRPTCMHKGKSCNRQIC